MVEVGQPLLTKSGIVYLRDPVGFCSYSSSPNPQFRTPYHTQQLTWSSRIALRWS